MSSFPHHIIPSPPQNRDDRQAAQAPQGSEGLARSPTQHSAGADVSAADNSSIPGTSKDQNPVDEEAQDAKHGQLEDGCEGRKDQGVPEVSPPSLTLQRSTRIAEPQRPGAYAIRSFLPFLRTMAEPSDHDDAPRTAATSETDIENNNEGLAVAYPAVSNDDLARATPVEPNRTTKGIDERKYFYALVVVSFVFVAGFLAGILLS